MQGASRTQQNRGRTADGEGNPIDRHVGRRIRLRRTLIGFSQEQLGAALGVTFQQVQKYERGANRVSASRLFDLGRILDVPVSFFFDDMEAETAAASPALLRLDQTTPEVEQDPVAKRESLDMLRAYYRIPDVNTRRKIYELIKAAAVDVDEAA